MKNCSRCQEELIVIRTKDITYRFCPKYTVSSLHDFKAEYKPISKPPGSK